MDRFVVGTGRCGSTLLSKMLAESPEMLSVFEYFNGLNGERRLAAAPVSGQEMWEVLSGPHPFVTMVTSRHFDVDEIDYPFDRPGMRYGREDDLPWVLVATLPRISTNPDRLCDELRELVLGLPTQPPADHHRQVFQWLAERHGKSVWNERSGSSIEFLPRLASAFPDGRFLHIHRAGEEAALSMREEHPFRLAISLVGNLDPEVDVLTALAHKLPKPGEDDPVRRVLERRPPAHYFGRFWADQLSSGYRGVAQLRPEQYTEVWFEDLVTKPAETMRRIASFFDIDPDRDGWIEKSVALVRGLPPTRADKIPAEEREQLALACRAGNRLLGRPA